jgi:hypothetical protein
VVKVGPAGLSVLRGFGGTQLKMWLLLFFCHSRVVASGSYPAFDMDVVLRLEVLLCIREVKVSSSRLGPTLSGNSAPPRPRRVPSLSSLHQLLDDI